MHSIILLNWMCSRSFCTLIIPLVCHVNTRPLCDCCHVSRAVYHIHVGMCQWVSMLVILIVCFIHWMRVIEFEIRFWEREKNASVAFSFVFIVIAFFVIWYERNSCNLALVHQFGGRQMWACNGAHAYLKCKQMHNAIVACLFFLLLSCVCFFCFALCTCALAAIMMNQMIFISLTFWWFFFVSRCLRAHTLFRW